MSAFFKDIFRSVRRSMSRFLSIIAITALGAGVFAGLAAAAPDMWQTGDDYFDRQNLMDLRLLSTYGFTESDIAQIRKEEGVRGVFATYSADVVANIDGTDYTLRLHGLPEDPARMSEDDMNLPVLVEGRWPEKKGECVLVKKAIEIDSEQIGDHITIANEDGALDNMLGCLEYEIVGFVESPYYLSFTLGTTDKGNGTLYYAAYVRQENFIAEVYTDVYVSIEGAKELDSFEEEYHDLIADSKARLEILADERQEIRLEEIRQEANEKLLDAKQEYADGKAEAEEQLAEAEAQLQDAREQIEKGEKELRDGQAEYDQGVLLLVGQKAEYQRKITAAEQQIVEAQQRAEQGKAQLAQAKAQLDGYETLFAEQSAAGQKQLEEERSKLETWSAQLEQLAEQIAAAEQIEAAGGNVPELPAMRQQYAEQMQQLAAAKALLEQKTQEGQKELAQRRAELDAAWEGYRGQEAVLKAGELELENGKAELERQKAEAEQGFGQAEAQLAAAKKQLESGKAEIASAKKELERGEREYADGKAEAEAQLADAERQIQDAEQQIAELAAPEWYILDRDMTESIVLFDASAERMNQLKTVFPVVFFLVAALVALTTMTRMVDEERGIIGTYKALGYSNAKIGFKYLCYAAMATILGSVLGIGLGMYFLPKIIWNAYGIVFSLPEMLITFHLGIAMQAIFALLFFTLGATYLACKASLFEVPARLLQPRAPKAGKRILLERITFLWKRLNFTAKTTARNLFLNKRRLIMTALGVAGCTALLVTAMGARDSVSTVLGDQFEDIYRFDVMATLEEQEISGELLDVLEDPQLFESYLQIMNKNMNVTNQDESYTMTAYLYVPSQPDRLSEFVDLRHRRDKAKISFGEDSVVITEKLAENLGLSPGDTLRLQSVTASDAREIELIVTDICENYVFNYVYVSPKVYERAAGKQCEFTQLVARTNPEGTQAAIQKLQELSQQVPTITLISDIIETVKGSIDSVNIIIFVLIILAGALAFIVLYNLTNINVGERVREIATLKVLGFRAGETNAYIFRETLILSMIGCILGLGLGLVLYQYVVKTVEVDILMLGRTVSLGGYLMASALTLLFTWLVSIFINRRIRQVDMVESLKSVD